MRRIDLVGRHMRPHSLMVSILNILNRILRQEVSRIASLLSILVVRKGKVLSFGYRGGIDGRAPELC